MGPMHTYLTSDDVAKALNIPKTTLFLWEAKGKIPTAKRHPMNKYRIYTEADVAKIRKIINKGL